MNFQKPHINNDYIFLRTKAIAWRDIKVVNNTAYIVSEAPDHGMQVFDLLQLRNKTGFHVSITFYYTLLWIRFRTLVGFSATFF